MQSLFAIVVVDYDDDFHAGHQGLNLAGELVDKGGIVVHGDFGYNIDREHLVAFRVVESMHLHNVGVGGQGLHHLGLQFGPSVLSCG